MDRLRDASVQIISVTTQATLGFEVFIDYLVESDDDDDYETCAREVAEWVSNTFKLNFVILESASRLIAGGAQDNKKAWDEGWNELAQYYPTGKYQLRCSAVDASWFLVKYKDTDK